MPQSISNLNDYRKFVEKPEDAAAYPLAINETLIVELGDRVVSDLIREAIIPESIVADKIYFAGTPALKEAYGWKPRIIN